MTTSKTPARDQARVDTEVRRLKTALEISKREADKAEIITAAIEGPFWKTVLEPFLSEHVRVFQENDCWVYTGDELVEKRGKARRSGEIRDHILKRVGKRAYYLDQAEKIARILDATNKEIE